MVAGGGTGGNDQDTGTPASAPDLGDALHALGSEGRVGLKSASEVLKALRILVAADISLARSAFGRTLAFTAVGIAFGASSWLLLMAALITSMQAAGLSWTVSLLVAAALSIVVTAAAGWAAMRYFEHTRLQATRRQFARLGFGELADLMPDAASHQSTAEAARRVADAQADAPIKKGMGVDVTPP